MGMCNGNGDLTFNYCLMLEPDNVREYVVVHELCHRLHMAHYKAFWDEVEKYYPKYKECEAWEKENFKFVFKRAGLF